MAWAIRHHPVSPPRSSNAACGFPALRSPTGFFAGIRRAADMSVIHVPTSPWRRDTACLEGPWSYRCFTGLRQYTDPRLLPQAHQKSGSFPPPALPGLSSTTTLSDSRRHRCPEAPLRPLPSCQSGSPPITRTTFPACCAQYPGGPDGCVCRFLPRLRGLPRYHGGSASTSVLSRPARASLALRPAGLLNRPRRPLSRGSDPASCPAKPLVSYRSYRQLSGWIPPPLVVRAFGAHTITHP